MLRLSPKARGPGLCGTEELSGLSGAVVRGQETKEKYGGQALPVLPGFVMPAEAGSWSDDFHKSFRERGRQLEHWFSTFGGHMSVL